MKSENLTKDLCQDPTTSAGSSRHYVPLGGPGPPGCAPPAAWLPRRQGPSCPTCRIESSARASPSSRVQGRPNRTVAPANRRSHAPAQDAPTSPSSRVPSPPARPRHPVPRPSCPHHGWADLRVAASSSRGAPDAAPPVREGPERPPWCGGRRSRASLDTPQSSVGAPAAGAGRHPTPPPPPPRASVRGRSDHKALHSSRAGTAAWPDGEGAGARPVRRPPRRWAVARRRSRLRAAPSPSPSACAAPNAAGAGRQADRDSIVREPSWTRRVASVPEGPGL